MKAFLLFNALWNRGLPIACNNPGAISFVLSGRSYRHASIARSCNSHPRVSQCSALNGTRPGYSIMQTLEIPAHLPSSIKDNLQRELRDNHGITLPGALHLFFEQHYPSITAARNAVRRGEILIGSVVGPAEGSTSYIITGGETLMVQRRLQAQSFPRGDAPFEMPVVYEDDHIGIVIKPPGVVTTKDHGEHGRLAVRTGLAYCLTPTRDTKDPLRRPVPAHRLDCATGGLLIAAKTRSATAAVSRMFVERQVHKRYMALVCGLLQPNVGRVEIPLGGQEAISDYEVVEAVRSLKFGWITLVSLRPRTGRTHQVR